MLTQIRMSTITVPHRNCVSTLFIAFPTFVCNNNVKHRLIWLYCHILNVVVSLYDFIHDDILTWTDWVVISCNQFLWWRSVVIFVSTQANSNKRYNICDFRCCAANAGLSFGSIRHYFSPCWCKIEHHFLFYIQQHWQ